MNIEFSYPKAEHKLSIVNTEERPYLSWLKNGIKTAEGRVNSVTCQNMKIGNFIVLVDKNREKYVHGKISFKHEYKTFKEMLVNEGVKNMLPFLDDCDLSGAEKIYKSFPGAERVVKFGCVAIGIDIIDYVI